MHVSRPAVERFEPCKSHLVQMLGAVLPGALLPLRLVWASARSFGSTAVGAARVTRQLAFTGTQASQVCRINDL